MEPRDIARLLHRFEGWEDEVLPVELCYSTWPQQADFICQGNYKYLLTYQNDMMKAPWAERYAANPPKRRPPEKLPRAVWGALCLFGLLLLLALITHLAAQENHWCEVPVDCPKCVSAEPIVKPTKDPQVVMIDLSTDAYFDFGEAELTGIHKNRLSNTFTELFKPFEGITITSVGAYTDPVGGAEDNRVLARNRANFIKQTLGDVMQSGRTGQFAEANVAETVLIKDTGVADDPSDKVLWDYCFKKFQSEPPLRYRPLVTLMLSKNKDSLPCSTWSEKGYPACARFDDGLPADTRIYLAKAENFRRLTTCLAPMRRAVIVFRFKTYKPDLSKDRSVTGAQ
ncbi:hypothetical protein ATDW_25570 [Asticcacaulis sp. DW145]|uniref:hypothetical protein n=1 Tax=Asticcacaulis sp. DW145 TaxID=3095608 RepID=UPI00308A9154|nr:hypothetical protein ATDW_25570 [Asticcacaulis sp. DW145]